MLLALHMQGRSISVVHFIKVNAGVDLMTQPSIFKGMRSLRDAQTSVMTTAPAQLGSALERTSPTLYTPSVSTMT